MSSMLIVLTSEAYAKLKSSVPSKGGMCRMANLPQRSIGGDNQKVGFQIPYD